MLYKLYVLEKYVFNGNFVIKRKWGYNNSNYKMKILNINNNFSNFWV